MLKPIYIVKMNGSYMNSYTSYTDASEMAAQLQRKWRNANITIESDYYEE